MDRVGERRGKEKSAIKLRLYRYAFRDITLVLSCFSVPFSVPVFPMSILRIDGRVRGNLIAHRKDDVFKLFSKWLFSRRGGQIMLSGVAKTFTRSAEVEENFQLTTLCHHMSMSCGFCQCTAVGL